MESFISFNSDSEDEDRLYCSAPQREEDIIWAGSDTEQSAEVIERKRLRYEYHAERCLQGKLPVLLSTSLKGPIPSDWVNPWKYRKRKIPDWWQPGSKDMLFTRANVMKRAAEHGMGHLEPRAALAWCKAEAEAEAKIKVGPQCGRGQSIRSEAESEEDQEDFLNLRNVHQNDNNCPRTGPPYFHNDDQQNSKAVSQHASVEYLDNLPEDNERSMKRPADTQWLKGSYVSKRAKWDTPAASSPTPMPDVQVHREHRRRHNSTRPSASRGTGLLSTSDLDTSWSHDAQIGEAGYPPIESTSAGGSRLQAMRTTRPLMLAYPISHKLSSASEKFNLSTHSSTPAFIQSSALSSATTSMKQPPYSSSLRLSSLQSLPHRRGSHTESIEDISFVTEIAPSSRDLENFQYRKKRRRSMPQQSVYTDESSDEETLPKPLLNSVTPELNDVPDNNFDSKLDEPPQDSSAESNMDGFHPDLSPNLIESHFDRLPPLATPQILTHAPQGLALSINKEESPLENKATIEHSCFDSSLDIMDEVRNLEPPVGEVSSANKVETMRNSSPDQVPTEEDLLLNYEPPETRASLSTTEPIVIRLSQASPRSTEAFAQGPAIPVVSEPQERPDESTQSYNTTPMASLQSRYHRCPASNEVAQSHGTDVDVVQVADNAAMLNESYQSTDRGENTHQAYLIRKIREQLCKITPELSGNPSEHVVEIGPSSALDEHRPKYLNRYSFPLFKTIDIAAKPPIGHLPEIPVLHKPNLSTHSIYGTTKNERAHQIDPNESASPGSPTLLDPQTINPGANTTLGPEETLDPMQIIQNSLSQDCQSSSKSSSQSDAGHPDSSSHKSSNKIAQVETDILMTIGSKELPFQRERDQASWKEPPPQSPWATVNIDPISVYVRDNVARDYGSFKQNGWENDASPERDTSENELEWRSLERPRTPEAGDGIKPFKDFMTPSPSPKASESQSTPGDVPSTQLQIETATGNPWTSTFRNPASGKSKKRVSFGVLPSEENEELMPSLSKSSKRVRGSPPIPRIVKHLGEEDTFDDDTTAVNKFEKHFVAAGRVKRVLREDDNLSSPAVGAMAEVFIAADRETSAEREQHQLSDKSLSRYLKHISKARANSTILENDGPQLIDSLSKRPNKEIANVTPKTIDYDFDDFLGDAGGFLEEWSVEAEMKKASASKSASNSRNSGGSMFSLGGW